MHPIGHAYVVKVQKWGFSMVNSRRTCQGFTDLFSNPDVSKEDALERMENEFSETMNTETLAATSGA